MSADGAKPTTRFAMPALVWGLGFVSLLTDIASDMVVPLFPAILASVGGGALALGFLEGLAEGASGIHTGSISQWIYLNSYPGRAR